LIYTDKIIVVRNCYYNFYDVKMLLKLLEK